MKPVRSTFFLLSLVTVLVAASWFWLASGLGPELQAQVPAVAPPTVAPSSPGSSGGTELSAPQQPHQEPVVRAVRRTLPAVVNIQTERVVERYYTTRHDAYFGRLFRKQEKVKNLGSGLLVSPDGYIVTNHHVVEMADQLQISVKLHDDQTHQARFIRSEPGMDLALIKIDLNDPLPSFDLSGLSPNLLGQTVIALGNPVGYSSSVSRGILSAKDREFEGEGVRMTGLLQTDAAINPGNSGGPLVDIEGKLVGINTAKFASVAVEGIGFAIPGPVVADWVRDAMAVANGQKPDGQPARIVQLLKERLGLEVENVGDRLARYFGAQPVAGLYVAGLVPGSPASRVGLQPGVVITEINGERVVNTLDLPRSLLQLQGGQTVELKFVEFRERGTALLRRPGSVRLRAQ